MRETTPDSRLKVNGLFQLNDAPFLPPSVPVLLQILSGATSASSLMPSGAIIPLIANKTYEINIPGGFPVRSMLLRCFLSSHSTSS